MGLRSSTEGFEQPFDRLPTGGGSPLPDAKTLETLLRTKTDRQLAQMFPSIKRQEWAAFRKALKIPEPL